MANEIIISDNPNFKKALALLQKAYEKESGNKVSSVELHKLKFIIREPAAKNK